MNVGKATELLEAARAGDEARVQALLLPVSAPEEEHALGGTHGRCV
jgi:hypothetical protein